jgi:hypothetical protein
VYFGDRYQRFKRSFRLPADESSTRLRNLHDIIYLLTAIGLLPGGSNTVHIYTQTIHRTTQNKQYIEQHRYFGRVRTEPRLCGLYPGICLITEEKARNNLSHTILTILPDVTSHTTIILTHKIFRRRHRKAKIAMHF